MSKVLAWAAGLFDGEGSISLKHPSTPVRIALEMVDEATVRRFARLVGAKVYGPYRHTEKCWTWCAEACGMKACSVLRTLIPLLYTKRRKAKIALLMERTMGKGRVRLSISQRKHRAVVKARFYGGK